MKKIITILLVAILATACDKRELEPTAPHVLELAFFLEDVSQGDFVTIKSDDGNSTTYHDLVIGQNIVQHTVTRSGQKLWLYDEIGKTIASTYYK